MPHAPTRRKVAAALLLLLGPALVGSLGPRTNFDQRLVAAHNRERSRAGVPPLAWDAALAAEARQWASFLSRTGRFEHSPNPTIGEPDGENIWGGTPGHFLPENMVGLWVSEKRHFKAGVFPANSTTGRVEDVSHYTQLMWRGSARVGCGLSSAGREEVLVCRYSSAGNILGETAF